MMRSLNIAPIYCHSTMPSLDHTGCLILPSLCLCLCLSLSPRIGGELVLPRKHASCPSNFGNRNLLEWCSKWMQNDFNASQPNSSVTALPLSSQNSDIHAYTHTHTLVTIYLSMYLSIYIYIYLSVELPSAHIAFEARPRNFEPCEYIIYIYNPPWMCPRLWLTAFYKHFGL